MRLAGLLIFSILGTPAFAQEAPKPSTAKGEAWVVRMGGKPLGTETATTVIKDGHRTLTTRGNLSGRDYTSVVTVKADDLHFVRNRLEVQGVKVVTAAIPTGVSIKADMFGKTKAKTVGGKAPFVVLENAVFSAYDLLTRYAVTVKGAFDFTLVVPSRMLGIKARFEPRGPYKTTFNGKPIEVRWGRVTVAGLEVDAAYDPRSGACYGVQVRSQKIEGFRKGFVLPAFKTLPPAKLPDGAREVEIQVPNALPGSLKALPGTLTLPKGPGPFPVAVLVQGSGATDRDETIGPNKPFRDLAYGLAAAGVATLRYDKRNWRENHDKVIPPERWKVTMREETILDAIAALKLVKTRKELGPRFMIGHSLGALAAPYVAKELPGLAGIVLMAGPGRPMDVLLREQQTYQLRVLGKQPEEIKKRVEKAMAPFAKIRSGELKGKARVFGASANYWGDIMKRDAPAVLKTLTLPVLVLQGAKDCQVLVKDYDALVAALKARPATTTHEAKLFPNLNHLFMKVKGKSTGVEYGIESRVDPAVLDTLTAWILRTARAK